MRKIVFAMGIRYRLNSRVLSGRPDISNQHQRWAMFVHGCFWHQHEHCRRATVPKRNCSFWLAKFKANRARDCKAVEELQRHGFKVLTLWECETQSRELLAAKISDFFQSFGKRDS